MKEKNGKIFSMDTKKKKAFDKIQHSFMIKFLKRIMNRKNKIKAMYEKLTIHIIFNGKKLKAFPLRSGTKQGCPLLSNI